MTTETLSLLDRVRERLESAFPGKSFPIIQNTSPAAQHSLLLSSEDAVEVAKFLRDGDGLKFDYLSNVTGVDWPERQIPEKKQVQVPAPDGNGTVTKEETTTHTEPGYLEAVYHLYSMELRHGPLIFRLRTQDRGEKNHLPSLTPVWRSAEFQEREVYDLFGIHFDGHPDLRRILMWEEFQDYPMRKDFVEPDDYEYEPTPHGKVLERVKARTTPAPQEVK